jgi:PKD repeat protein
VVPVAPGNSAIAAHAPQICLGNNITFNPAAFDPTSTYSWDFGDGSTATTSSATHLYTTNGTYTISLSVTTAQGCLSSSTSSVIVNALPVVAFATSSACPGIPINFDNNTTVISLPTTVSLNWNFGDLSSGASTANISGTGGSGDITHSYVSGGSYSVTLTATANGCTSTSTQTVTVYPSPVASFTFGPACQGSNVSFTNTSTISDASALTYLWDFTGVGPTSSTQDPSYSYGPAATGSFNVTLTTTSVNGCVSDTTQTISISPNPIPSFTTANACESSSATNNTAIFTNTTPLIGTLPLTSAWNFGDGNLGILTNESNSYLTPGTYIVSLTVTSASGCVGSTTNSVTIFPIPAVGFSAPNSCAAPRLQPLYIQHNHLAHLEHFQ